MQKYLAIRIELLEDRDAEVLLVPLDRPTITRVLQSWLGAKVARGIVGGNELQEVSWRLGDAFQGFWSTFNEVETASHYPGTLVFDLGGHDYRVVNLTEAAAKKLQENSVVTVDTTLTFGWFDELIIYWRSFTVGGEEYIRSVPLKWSDVRPLFPGRD